MSDTLNEAAETETITSDSSDAETQNLEKSTRKFTPKFGSFLDIYPCGDHVTSTSEVEAKLRKFKEIGIDEWIVQPWIIYDSAKKELQCIPTIDEMKEQIEYAHSIGLATPVLKIHMYGISKNIITSSTNTKGSSSVDTENSGSADTENNSSADTVKSNKTNKEEDTGLEADDFQAKYRQIVLQIAGELKDLEMEYCVIFNENEWIYNNPDWDKFVLELIGDVKALKYKVGISTMGISKTLLMSDSILQSVDAFFGNTYPAISNKLEKTEYIDAVNAWDYDDSLLIFKYLKDTYNKPVIVFETGVMDYWACLDNPGEWCWPVEHRSESNGKTEALMLYGILNSELSKIADKVWWCYDNLDRYAEVKALLKEYLGGNK